MQAKVGEKNPNQSKGEIEKKSRPYAYDAFVGRSGEKSSELNTHYTHLACVRLFSVVTFDENPEKEKNHFSKMFPSFSRIKAERTERDGDRVSD